MMCPIFLLNSIKPYFSFSCPQIVVESLLGTSNTTHRNHLQTSLHVLPGGSGKTQAAPDIDLHLPRGPRTSTLGSQLQTTIDQHPTTSTNDTLNGLTQQAPEPQ